MELNIPIEHRKLILQWYRHDYPGYDKLTDIEMDYKRADVSTLFPFSILEQNSQHILIHLSLLDTLMLARVFKTVSIQAYIYKTEFRRFCTNTWESKTLNKVQECFGKNYGN